MAHLMRLLSRATARTRVVQRHSGRVLLGKINMSNGLSALCSAVGLIQPAEGLTTTLTSPNSRQALGLNHTGPWVPSLLARPKDLDRPASAMT